MFTSFSSKNMKLRSFKSLLTFSSRAFARNVGGARAKPVSISARLEEATKQREEFMQKMEDEEIRQQAEEEVKSDPAYGHHDERVNDPHFKEYSPYALVTLPIDRVPEEISKRMTKVFSKHQAKEVREWGYLLMKNYQLLHAIEKPMNLQYVKPYANTSDLLNQRPHIHPRQAKAKDEEEKKKKEEEMNPNKQKQGEEEGKEQSTIEMEQ